MANTVISPNMNLPVPVVSVDPGPDWAGNINASLSIIDGHNHTAGSGVQINPLGLNINSDLTFQSNNATNLRSTRFTPQAVALVGASDLGCLYELGVDLYYIDGSGNNVRLTQGGTVTGATGTITGLPSGTASASFAGGAFTFQSATSTPASLNVGPTTIAQAVPSGKGVTISASGSQAANYNLTLPIALPTVSSATISDNAGNLSFTALAGGTYTPTIAPITGTAQAALGPFFYTRIGNIVTVSGSVTGVSNGASNLAMSTTLPINPTNTFVNTYDLVGVSGFLSSVQGNSVFAITSTRLAEIFIGIINSGTSIAANITFTYSCA